MLQFGALAMALRACLPHYQFSPPKKKHNMLKTGLAHLKILFKCVHTYPYEHL